MPQALLDAVTKYMNAGHNQYAPMAGALPLREAIAETAPVGWGQATTPTLVTPNTCELRPRAE